VNHENAPPQITVKKVSDDYTVNGAFEAWKKDKGAKKNPSINGDIWFS
jgi:hypothetical protein